MLYVIQRMAQLLFVLIGVTMVAFLLLYLTGDPAVAILGTDATPATVAALRTELGLDRSLPHQFGVFVLGVVRGDFGRSLRFREPALDLFMERLPATLELAAAALAISVVFGMTLGVLAAVNHGRRLDGLVRLGSLVGQAIPGFYLGLVAIIVFGAQLGWLPTGGRGTLANLLLPAATLAAYYTATTTRFVRSAMLDVLGADFVRTARSKGLRERVVIIRHALRNSLIGVATLIGLQTGALLSGAVVTETVFSWPGIGRLAVQAIYTRDFPVVRVTIIMAALIFVVINLITDLFYTYLDPRIRVKTSP